MKSLFIRALSKEPVERPPVWMMRQAGRYMKEYRDLKEKHSFLELCKTPELALEVTMQPIRFLDPDAAILFADILLPGEAMGFELDFAPGPKILNPVQNRSDLQALKRVDPHTSLDYVFKAIMLIKSELASHYQGEQAKAVIGFAGAPWTMACYFTEQGPIKLFQGTQVKAADDPQTMHLFLERLTDVIGDYLLGQIESGADAVQLFDTWAGNLSVEEYREFALPYTQKIIQLVQKTGCPTILYVNGSSHLLEQMKQSGADCLSVDWRTDLHAAETLVGEKTALQGNYNPANLFGSVDSVRERTRKMLASLKRRTAYVANLGHGIFQTTPPENARVFVDTVKEGWINR